ncbi:MAG: NAD(+) synthase [Prolixibacteraceae bacterium]|nr:NAD(+) synthase [Prolixibacteraceae bacterium]
MEKEIKSQFSRDILKIKDIDLECNRIVNQLKEDVFGLTKRKGAVVGISGGIDSSTTLALAAKAIGSENILGVLLPEKDSSQESKDFALKLAKKFNVQTIEEDITGALEGFGCYSRRDEAVKRVFPEYNPSSFKMKIGVNQSGLNQFLPPVFSITIIDPNGQSQSKILHVSEYLQIVAASNFKQRCRMSMLYYHAERLHYAMLGTPNKHEVEQGFFVKYGDGGADIMPIAHLYKSQVYQLAEHLGVPEEILTRTPTTDTYTAEQTQEEFFFQMSYQDMDIIWFGLENNVSPGEVGSVVGKTAKEIELIYNNLKRKHRTTEYLRMSPVKY